VWGDAHPPPVPHAKCSGGYAKLTTRIATVSRIATIASALLEISRSLMVSVLSVLLDAIPRLKV